jgi:hypothetical protein
MKVLSTLQSHFIGNKTNEGVVHANGFVAWTTPSFVLLLIKWLCSMDNTFICFVTYKMAL